MQKNFFLLKTTGTSQKCPLLKKKCLNATVPVILALGRLRQEDLKFKTTLAYTATLS
jgi:hypothetical protein